MLWEKLTPELVANAIVGLALILGAARVYILNKSKPAPHYDIDASMRGIAMGYGHSEQTERLIAAIERIADIMEGKKQAGLEHTVRQILERMDDVEKRDRRRAARARRRAATN